MSEKENNEETAGAGKTRGSEFLTFRLGDEEYGVNILQVQEIRGWEKATRIPNTPGYVIGVLNLRGAIVPIFDLRQRLNIPPRAYDKETVIIVLRVIGIQAKRSIGVVVDRVSDVLEADVADIRNTPDFGARFDTEFITGLATAGEKMIMLLDVDRLQPPLQERDDASDSEAA